MAIHLHLASLLLLAAIPLSAQTKPAPAPNENHAKASAVAVQEVIDAEHEWAKSAVAGDAAAFARFMDDDYVALYPDGRAVDKASWVADLRTGRDKFQSVDLHNMKVHLHGETAVVTAEYTQKATDDGKDSSGSGVYMDTWVRRNGRWQVVGSCFP